MMALSGLLICKLLLETEYNLKSWAVNPITTQKVAQINTRTTQNHFFLPMKKTLSGNTGNKCNYAAPFVTVSTEIQSRTVPHVNLRRKTETFIFTCYPAALCISNGIFLWSYRINKMFESNFSPDCTGLPELTQSRWRAHWRWKHFKVMGDCKRLWDHRKGNSLLDNGFMSLNHRITWGLQRS